MKRELTMTVETTENSAQILTEVLLGILQRHPELAITDDEEAE